MVMRRTFSTTPATVPRWKSRSNSAASGGAPPPTGAPARARWSSSMRRSLGRTNPCTIPIPITNSAMETQTQGWLNLYALSLMPIRAKPSRNTR